MFPRTIVLQRHQRHDTSYEMLIYISFFRIRGKAIGVFRFSLSATPQIESVLIERRQRSDFVGLSQGPYFRFERVEIVGDRSGKVVAY